MVKKAQNLIENTELTLSDICDELSIGQKALFNIFKKYPEDFKRERKARSYSRSKSGDNNHWTGVTGSDHPKFKGDISDGKGYTLVLRPDWFTGRTGSNHVFKHHVVLCANLNLNEIPEGYVVHHCNCVPTDNDFNNLVLMTRSEHGRLHQYLRESAETISKESTLKWVEAVRAETL